MDTAFTDALENFKKHYINYHLNSNNKKVSIVAEKLGIDRTTLYKKIKKYEIDFA